jgi:hypothetical protein
MSQIMQKPCARALCGVALLVVLGLGAAGCGLLDPDIASFDLDLPPKEFVVDTNDWELAVTGATFPAIDCSPDPGICAAAAGQLCTGGGATCFAACGAAGTCEATVLVQLWDDVNLAAESEELSSLDGSAVITVTINRMWFDVTENTMNADTPELGVYVAPATVMSIGSPQAKKVGTIAPVQAGITVQDGEIVFAAGGQEDLKAFMSDFRTPFNFIVGSTLVFAAGDPMPMGRAVATVNVSATAKAGF